MPSDRRRALPLLLVTTALLACRPDGRSPVGSASASARAARVPSLPPVPSARQHMAMASDAGTPELPSGTYHLEATSRSDSCSPKQAVAVSADVFVSARIVPDGPQVTVPVVIREDGSTSRRQDLLLREGAGLRNILKVAPPMGVATRTIHTAIRGVRADGFRVVATSQWEGIEREDGGLPAGAPSSSCRAEQELTFTLVKELCPARCTMDGPEAPCACPK